MTSKLRIILLIAILLAGLLECLSAGAEPVRVRDRLWAWGHHEGSYNGTFGLPGTSRITPIEGATYLGLRNLIFIRYLGKPAYPWDQYAIPFRAMDRLMWSATGASGQTSAEERQRVLQLAKTMPNLRGLFLDDFFVLSPAAGGKPGRVAAMKVQFSNSRSTSFQVMISRIASAPVIK
jgi:hypothetical protein